MKPWEMYQQHTPAPSGGVRVAPAAPSATPVGGGQAGPWTQYQAQQPPREPNTYEQYVAPVGRAIGGAAEYVYDAVAGKHDPKFQGVGSIEQLGILPIGELSRAKLTAPDDKGYGEIIKRMLGPSVVGSEVDANGYEVLSIKGPDGKVHKGYVNRPGLDAEDVDRGISAAVPYMVGGGVAGRLAGGPNLLLRAGAQGAAAGGVSLGQDVAAQGFGATAPPNMIKAGVAAGAGVGGEVLGAVVGPMIKRWVGNREIVDSAGQLTARGRKLAEKNGMDPNAVDRQIALEIQRRSATALDQNEAIRGAASDAFGIPSTKAQRTNSGTEVLREKDINAGAFGTAASERLKDFKQNQYDQVSYVALGKDNSGQRFSYPSATPREPTMTGPLWSTSPKEPGGPIAQQLAPHRTFADLNNQTLGQGAQEGFATAAQTAKMFEKNAWAKVTNIEAKVAAKRILPDHIKKSLGTMRIVEKEHPQSTAMIDQLVAFQAGKAPKDNFSDFLGQQSVTYVDEMRRVLLGHVRNANKQNGDSTAAGAIYRGYLDWVQDAASKKMLTGDVAGATALREAINATKEARSIMTARIKAGAQSTKASQVLDKVKGANTGEEVIAALAGKSSPDTGGIAAHYDGLKAYKAALDRFAGKDAKPAWDDVRVAMWTRMVSKKDGEAANYGVMAAKIEGALQQNKSVMKLLYTPGEIVLMRKFANSLRAINPTDPNPSGTGAAVARLMPSLAKEAAYTQAKRETFSHNNVFMARIYRMLGSYIKTFEKPTGRVLTNKAVSQATTQKPSTGLTGYAVGPWGATTPSDRNRERPVNSMYRGR